MVRRIDSDDSTGFGMKNDGFHVRSLSQGPALFISDGSNDGELDRRGRHGSRDELQLTPESISIIDIAFNHPTRIRCTYTYNVLCLAWSGRVIGNIALATPPQACGSGFAQNVKRVRLQHFR